MIVGVLIIVLALTSNLTEAWAQAVVNASLTGRILDPSQAAVSDAAVMLKNEGTNAEQITHSNANGIYYFARVERGTYTLTVEKEGFSRGIRQGVEVSTGEAKMLDMQLALGELSASMTVPGEAAITQRQNSSISVVIDRRRVRELPLNGRNFQKLLALTPGLGTPTSTLAVANLPTNGARASANTYTLDGASFSDERFDSGIAVGGGPAGFSDSAPNLISTEAVDEFRVVTSNADATYGRSSGAQIVVVTRSGTNALDGAIYQYLRNSAFDSRDFFNYGPFRHVDGRAKTPPLRQNLFGGSIGGPIRKDRHFFFGNFEGFLQRRELTFTPTVPNAALLNLIPGDLGRFYRTYYIDRGIVPAAGLPPGSFSPLAPADRAAALAAGFPAVLFDGEPANGEAGTVLLSSSATNDVTHYSFLGRTDHRITDKLLVTVRYAFAQPKQTNTQGFDFTESRQRVQSALVQGVYAVSPSQLIEVRGAVFRSRSGDGLKDGVVDPRLAALGLPRNGVSLTVAGTSFPSVFLQPVGSRVFQTVPQWMVMHAATKGNVILRTGLEIRDVSARFRRGFQETPSYTFRGFVGRTGLLGAASKQEQALADSVFGTLLGTNGGPTTSLRGWRSLQQDYFVQADWRVLPHLTLNLGTRYSYFGVQQEDINAASNLFAAIEEVINPKVHPFHHGRTANRVVPLGKGVDLYQPDGNNLQPRVGGAWDISRRGTSILRGAYGLYTDRIFQGHFALNVGNIPYSIASFILGAPFRLGPEFPVNPSIPSIWAVDPTLRNPETHRINVAFEQSVGANTSVTIAYVASRARRLLRALEPNGSGSVPQALRPDPRFSDQRLVTNYASADYDALQVFGRGRMSSGLSFTWAYTFGQSKDNLWNDALTGTPRAPSLLNLAANASTPGVQPNARFVDRPARADWGFSDFDIRHQLSWSLLFEPPFGRSRKYELKSSRLLQALASGWSAALLGIHRGGDPIYLQLGRDVDGDGDVTRDRPGLLRGSLSELYRRDRGNKTQWLLPLTEALTRLGNPSNAADPATYIPRNSLRAPSLANLDLSLSRKFRVGEHHALGFEANVFNLFNRANFAAPITLLTDARFGSSIATRRGFNPRQIQVGLRFTF